MAEMNIVYEKIKPTGEIRIPKSILAKLGLKSGEKVRLKLTGKKVLIEPIKDPIKALRGMLKLDKKTAKEIIESPEFEPT
ncbi:MAG: AbrB/MazE/SpoVT family DNA-binding domain-containing protein [Candidatus Altiarchaeota archaeon]|nr:AbrB/MazE/SpoVT family DNA-binding domain-containing protein [Candidatus Altiarchaeota archaeon]